MRPQRNAHRSALDLSGVWRIAFDPDDHGEAEGWANGLPPDQAHPIAVPGSWNEQLAALGWMDYVGAAWLETDIVMPPVPPTHCAELRFAGVYHDARVFLDGVPLGGGGEGLLPFTVALPDGAPGPLLRLVVRVDARLPEQGPTQRVTLDDYAREGRLKDEYHPAVRFDFFPFGGINRPVHLVVRPREGITGYRAVTTLAPALELEIAARGGSVAVQVEGHGAAWRGCAPVQAGQAVLKIDLPGAALWSSERPTLYNLTITLLNDDGVACDEVGQRIGVRTVRVDGARLLLNEAPVELRGFGKHEDAPAAGRGLDLPQLVQDFHLLKWCGANSVRTSHYPYGDEFYDLADAMGVLVIDELFSINLDFRRVAADGLDAHKAALAALVERDRNRTCVVAWSLANEPGYLGEVEYRERSGRYWAELFAHARALDPTRPLTHANVTYAGIDDPAFAQCDFVSINRYFGWYTEPAQLDRATMRLRGDLDTLAKLGKPIFLSEFGADAMAGEHAVHDQLFTEEYQARFIAAYWREIEGHPACVGGHVWNFADFRTAQHGRRVVHNRKGVFTRTREPKLAAWTVRRLWTGRDLLDRP